MTEKQEKGPAKQKIRVIEIDVLKPHKPNIVELGRALCDLKSVDTANISVYAIDEKTESIKATLEGENIDFDEVEKTIDSYGAVIHSIDKVIAGKKRVIDVPLTPKKE
ncbi:DUF211 domain-containing protein [Candidatus Micrarchaeota archaeon]|nr:DUF211 domain-containing protein [Candidatus Micrarchaeota archaeon]MBU2476194.1 DUF211 domain-containing protein [Candidatus Micrarchaeota archaeon]